MKQKCQIGRIESHKPRKMVLICELEFQKSRGDEVSDDVNSCQREFAVHLNIGMAESWSHKAREDQNQHEKHSQRRKNDSSAQVAAFRFHTYQHGLHPNQKANEITKRNHHELSQPDEFCRSHQQMNANRQAEETNAKRQIDNIS